MNKIIELLKNNKLNEAKLEIKKKEKEASEEKSDYLRSKLLDEIKKLKRIFIDHINIEFNNIKTTDINIFNNSDVIIENKDKIY